MGAQASGADGVVHGCCKRYSHAALVLGGAWLTLRQAFRKFSGGPKSRVELMPAGACKRSLAPDARVAKITGAYIESEDHGGTHPSVPNLQRSNRSLGRAKCFHMSPLPLGTVVERPCGYLKVDHRCSDRRGTFSRWLVAVLWILVLRTRRLAGCRMLIGVGGGMALCQQGYASGAVASSSRCPWNRLLSGYFSDGRLSLPRAPNP